MGWILVVPALLAARVLSWGTARSGHQKPPLSRPPTLTLRLPLPTLMSVLRRNRRGSRPIGHEALDLSKALSPRRRKSTVVCLSGSFTSRHAAGFSCAISGGVLQTKRATDLAELHRRIAKRDIPTTHEVEVLAENGHFLAHVQDDESAIRRLDEGVDALLLGDA
jgi:hypothetical protein